MRARDAIVTDREWLATWVDARHPADSGAAAAAAGGPIVLQDFLHPSIAERARAFLQTNVDYRLVTGPLYQFHVIAAARPDARLGSNAVAYLRLRQALGDPRFAAFVARRLGIDLGAGEFDAHIMRTGDFLAPHTDDLDERRAAAVLFLSRDWPASFGGALRIDGGERGCWIVEPRFNTFVAFDVTTGGTHAVDRVLAPAAAARLTISGWFQRPR